MSGVSLSRGDETIFFDHWTPRFAKPAPGRGCCIATSVLQGSSVILRKHTRARMVCAIIELFKQKKTKKNFALSGVEAPSPAAP